MKFDKFISKCLLIPISISFLTSCTSPSKGKSDAEEIQEIANRIIEARQDDNF